MITPFLLVQQMLVHHPIKDDICAHDSLPN